MRSGEDEGYGRGRLGKMRVVEGEDLDFLF